MGMDIYQRNMETEEVLLGGVVKVLGNIRNCLEIAWTHIGIIDNCWQNIMDNGNMNGLIPVHKGHKIGILTNKNCEFFAGGYLRSKDSRFFLGNIHGINAP